MFVSSFVLLTYLMLILVKMLVKEKIGGTKKYVKLEEASFLGFINADARKYGIDEILHPLVNDLKILVTTGIALAFAEVPVHGTVAKITGDNFGRNITSLPGFNNTMASYVPKKGKVVILLSSMHDDKVVEDGVTKKPEIILV
ncbi:hypothetical protein F2P81_005052 [Scophthalmus maximus]|uniref:Uncharacterized protein n=1 Tax=Scophthalmus maximus TaxID=52904 RepID=A0A6A4TES5_SCOMX|nr:hypothetical protein F2P81_005052 [Scophthalmus maximus]